MRTHRIAVMPMDGIGREVIPAAVCVLRAAERAVGGFQLAITDFDWSARKSLETGEPIVPPGGFDTLRGFDAILFGAHGGTPGIPDDVAFAETLFAFRLAFDEYINLRPCKLLPGIPAVLAQGKREDVDFVIVRENVEGELAGPGGRTGVGTPWETASQLTVISRANTERVARYSFNLARSRRKRLANITKSNAMRHAYTLWDEVIAAVGTEYPDVQLDKFYVDAAAARMVLRPQDFDVLLCTNLFGDILSDLGAALAGGLGVAASGNLNPEGVAPSLFEPVHGSAPDIAGRGIANPVAAIGAGALMLRHLGETAAADAVEAAMGRILRDGEFRTPDLGGGATTDQMADAIARNIGKETNS
ncbi:MAG: isocitrate/isopropylmalate family dehydrogenase [Chloroflexota bacterium]|nr:isocitrate/isopropylmalate family dehydrogenase [Chloroflexota bacterium]